MKVLFLDNDGVICLSNNWGGRTKKWANYRSANPDSSKDKKDAPVFVRFDDFDNKAIKILNEILEETGAEIVVSSDWKLHATLEELGEYYESQGIIKKRKRKNIKLFNVKNIKQLFRRQPDLLEKPEVQELIEYTQELEGQVMERKVEDNYDKEHMLKSMLSDILSSCREYEENKILQDRYPELYKNIDADTLVKNLMAYIISMNIKNNLRL